MEVLFKNAMGIAKRVCNLKLSKGDVVIDATMGNGNDTIFLCELVGNSGKVYAFDVQEGAINSTREKLSKLNYLERAELIHDGHENMNKYISEKVKLVIFNLGYLPRGNHEITTKRETTIEAVNKSLELLEVNGVVAIVIYHGHENGKLEREALYEFTSNLNQKEYNVVKMSFINQVNNPPELICIEKI